MEEFFSLLILSRAGNDPCAAGWFLEVHRRCTHWKESNPEPCLIELAVGYLMMNKTRERERQR